MKILLYGLRASGKSTIGEELGKQIDKPVFDLDTIILNGLQKEYGEKMTISKFVEEVCGGTWYKFRDREHRALGNTLKKEDKNLVALGGGTIAFNRNRHLIDPIDNYLSSPHTNPEAKNGVTRRIFNREKFPKTSTRVFLDISPEEQMRRLKEDDKGNKNRPDLGKGLEEIYNARIKNYRKFADITVGVDGKSIEKIVGEILGYPQIQEAIKKSA